jgi:hypothetical protein
MRTIWPQILRAEHEKKSVATKEETTLETARQKPRPGSPSRTVHSRGAPGRRHRFRSTTIRIVRLRFCRVSGLFKRGCPKSRTSLKAVLRPEIQETAPTVVRVRTRRMAFNAVATGRRRRCGDGQRRTRLPGPLWRRSAVAQFRGSVRRMLISPRRPVLLRDSKWSTRASLGLVEVLKPRARQYFRGPRWLR